MQIHFRASTSTVTTTSPVGLIRRQTQSNIALASEETGVVGKARTPASRLAISALGGKAWGVIVEASDGKINVSYYPNEACASSGTFAYKKGKWLLVSMDEACD
jgi:hypothetical protein